MARKKSRPPKAKKRKTWKPITGADQRWVYIMRRDLPRRFEIRIKDLIAPCLAVGAGIYFYPDGWTPGNLLLVAFVAFTFSVITTQHQYKIGIAKNPDWRHQDVDEDVPGKVTLLRCRMAPNARALEKKLHSIYGDSRFTLQRVGPSAGATEWFYFTDIEYLTLEYLLWYYAAEAKIAPWIVLLILALGAAIYINHKIISHDPTATRPPGRHRSEFYKTWRLYSAPGQMRHPAAHDLDVFRL